ncbi:MAG: flagellar hook capping FlgD N-terminal domain-containing protein [Micavibrio sp.]|nr:flagellar hook capping FlgD N-terminal domain-containing protein [Micavibrio sp.]
MTYAVSQTSTATTIGSSSSSTSTTAAASADAATQKDMFLQILLTQLQNQNPLDPVDTTEFTSQLATYSQLEQQIDTNSKLDDVVSALNSGNNFSALSYNGATVEVAGNTSVVQSNTASWNYALATDATSVTATVKDANGNTLETDTIGAENAGTYSFNVDATSYGLPEGTPLYLTVAATDSTGAAVTASTAGNMKVTAVETDTDGSITLEAGSYSFSSDDVTKLRQTA